MPFLHPFWVLSSCSRPDRGRYGQGGKERLCRRNRPALQQRTLRIFPLLASERESTTYLEFL